MRQIIQDPRHDAEIDVTGWQLDQLAETLTNLRQAVAAGSDRELTDEEWDAVTDEPYGLAVGSCYRFADEPGVHTATERLAEIVDEAIYQRDLASARAKAGTGLTGPERAAYDRYVADLGRA